MGNSESKAQEAHRKREPHAQEPSVSSTRMAAAAGAPPIASTAAGPGVLKRGAFGDIVPNVNRTGGIELVIKFGDLQVEDGMTLRPSQAAQEPTFDIRSHRHAHGLHFALLLVDPDAPDPADPINRSWLHWAKVNIPGHQQSAGDVLAPYQGPAPPRGTHRYIFVLYEQPQPPTHQQAYIPVTQLGGDGSKRAKFDLAQWAHSHALGDPMAALCFFSAPEGGLAPEPASPA